jgi:hypothetical protein
MYPDVGDLMFSETNHSEPAFLDDDFGLHEEEKENTFMHYMRNSYHHPTMTKVVEDRVALTELYLKSTKAVADHLFKTQFEIAHLAPRMQEMGLGIFRANIAAFSKHAADLGCVKDIEIKIPLKSNEPHVQKYFPVPHALQLQLRAVLDQYLEYNIIRECDEPSIFCSNLLVVKTKDGKKIPVILDGRLIKHYTIQQAAQFVLHAESQPLTTFYSEAHGKRYCFKRCLQGLHNSPLQLKLLMDKLFGNMANVVIHNADNILIAKFGTLAHLLKIVEKVLQRLIKGNIKIRPTKVNLCRENTELLGIVWTKGKISIQMENYWHSKNYLHQIHQKS